MRPDETLLEGEHRSQGQAFSRDLDANIEMILANVGTADCRSLVTSGAPEVSSELGAIEHRQDSNKV